MSKVQIAILGQTEEEARFWAKVKKAGPDDCWLWQGAVGSRGYGNFMVGSRRDNSRRAVRVHRFAYELLVGPIQEGMTLDHLCRNRICVNHAHLEVVTNKQNILRGNAPSAQNARKQVCSKGHLYDLFNMYMQSNGRRRCRRCHANQAKNRYHRKLAIA